jgi:hypothetical protein
MHPLVGLYCCHLEGLGVRSLETVRPALRIMHHSDTCIPHSVMHMHPHHSVVDRNCFWHGVDYTGISVGIRSCRFIIYSIYVNVNVKVPESGMPSPAECRMQNSNLIDINFGLWTWTFDPHNFFLVFRFWLGSFAPYFGFWESPYI